MSDLVNIYFDRAIQREQRQIYGNRVEYIYNNKVIDLYNCITRLFSLSSIIPIKR